MNQNQYKKNKTIKNTKNSGFDDRVLRDIRSFSESKEDYHKPMRTGNGFSSNYIKYENNGNKEKTILINDYLDKIEPYLNGLMDNHRTQGERETQLTMAINFILLKIVKKLVLCIQKVITLKLLKNFLILFHKVIKKAYEKKWEEAIFLWQC